jgi:hypothetical protein
LAGRRSSTTFAGTMTVPPPNLLDLMPARAQRFEAAADGRITVLVPRLRHPLLVRWLRRLAARPVRVRLDEVGSFVWQQCDGRATVETIVERVRARFGDDADATLARTAQFVRTLVKGNLVTLDRPREAA